MKVVYDTKSFVKEMNRIMDYSAGFIQGIERGKLQFLNSVGATTIEMLKQYIDSHARANPYLLHHVYEWDQVGSPEARLFNIKYSVSSLGISFVGTLTQSQSVQKGSSTPFYNKAQIMESGMPVVIRPKNAEALSFKDGEEQVFTKSPVKVESPGGTQVAGGFEKTMDSFFNQYFTQAFLQSSGILSYLRNPTAFKANMRSGKSSGKSKGIEVGYRWIVNAATGVID